MHSTECVEHTIFVYILQLFFVLQHMSYSEGQGFQDVVEETCEDEVTVMPIGAADADANGKRRTSYADSVAEITDDEGSLRLRRVLLELKLSITWKMTEHL